MSAGQAPRAQIRGLGASLLSTNGARADQKEHLRFLGIDLDETHICKENPEYTPLASMGEVRSAFGTTCEDRGPLDARLLAGLHDRSAAATLRTGLHLFRHARRDGPGSVATAFDQVGLELLERMNVSPVWLLLLAALFDRCRIRLRGTAEDAPDDISIRQEQQDDEPIMTMSIHIGGGMRWNGEGVDTGRQLPQTIQEAGEGSALSRVISHPVLDRHPLVMQEARLDGFLDVGYVPYSPVDWGSGFDPGMRTLRKSLPA